MWGLILVVCLLHKRGGQGCHYGLFTLLQSVMSGGWAWRRSLVLSGAETFWGLLPPSLFSMCPGSELPLGILTEHCILSPHVLVLLVDTAFEIPEIVGDTWRRRQNIREFLTWGNLKTFSKELLCTKRQGCNWSMDVEHGGIDNDAFLFLIYQKVGGLKRDS